MKGHRFDPLSFVFGLAFVCLAIAMGVVGVGAQLLNLRWFAAVFLLLIGVLLIVTSRSRSRDRT